MNDPSSDTFITSIRKRAEQGNARAQKDLGIMYFQGGMLPQNDVEALKWYRKAADQGDAEAQSFIGVMYASGRGVPQNYEEALKWYRKAADQEFAEAHFNISTMYNTGKGVPQDFVEGMKWFLKAAFLGYPEAQKDLGLMYANGRGLPQNDSEALKWFLKAADKIELDAEIIKFIRKAADQGVVQAQTILGITYCAGRGVPQDDAEALRLFRKAADQGFAEAQTLLGTMCGTGRGVPRNYVEAVKWFRKAADQDFAEAQSLLGTMYGSGHGVPRDDAEAAKWFLKAADKGVPEAQSILGEFYSVGHGVPQDDFEALKWLHKAADKGFARAQAVLGTMYGSGHGVPQDDAVALRWFRKAADQGFFAKAEGVAEAQSYLHGGVHGVPQDDAGALKWYLKAADPDVTDAESQLEPERAKRTPEREKTPAAYSNRFLLSVLTGFGATILFMLVLSGLHIVNGFSSIAFIIFWIVFGRLFQKLEWPPPGIFGSRDRAVENPVVPATPRAPPLSTNDITPITAEEADLLFESYPEEIRRMLNEKRYIEQLLTPGRLQKAMEDRKLRIEIIRQEMYSNGFLSAWIYGTFSRRGREQKRRAAYLHQQIAFGKKWLALAPYRTNSIQNRLKVLNQAADEFNALEKKYANKEISEWEYKNSCKRIHKDLYGRSILHRMLVDTSSPKPHGKIKGMSLDEQVGEAFF